MASQEKAVKALEEADRLASELGKAGERAADALGTMTRVAREFTEAGKRASLSLAEYAAEVGRMHPEG